MYKAGFILEAFVAGVIQRSKYIKRLNAPTSLKTLISIAQSSRAHHGKLRTYIRKVSEYNESDLLDAVYGIDFLLQIADDVIAIDITLDLEAGGQKLHHLKQSAIALKNFGITKWAVLCVGDGYTVEEMDLLEIHLEDQQFQLIHLIDCNY